MKYNFPEVVCNAPKEKSPEDVIERLHLDYIGDNEVDGFIRSVILECRTMAKIKKSLSSAFPCAKRKHPSWVQEAEWPMGSKAPLRFISESREGEKRSFLFEDIDSGEQRMIE